MKHINSLTFLLHRRSVLALLALLVLFPLSAAQVRAEVRLQIPEETFGPPFYARLEASSLVDPVVPNNGEWAAIVIYRQLDCIPDEFNLLDVFDVPAAFFCPLNNVSGYEVWENEPGVDPAPIHTRLIGEGPLPVWFVRLGELLAAIEDGVLTLPELRALPSLREGATDFYDELLRPSEANEFGLLHINAQGDFADGSRFRLLWTLNRPPGAAASTRRARIELPGASAPASSPPLTFPFTGHWYDPAVPGQGLGIHPVRGRDQMFLTWYTYGSDGQPTWYALDSCLESDDSSCLNSGFDGLRADLVVMRSNGGVLNQPSDVILDAIGTMTIDFTSCTSAVASYELDGEVGSMELLALVSADNCTD